MLLKSRTPPSKPVPEDTCGKAHSSQDTAPVVRSVKSVKYACAGQTCRSRSESADRSVSQAIEKICPARTEHEPTITPIPCTLRELEEALIALIKCGLQTERKEVCFCFFIDGLDEYDGENDHYWIVELVDRSFQGRHRQIDTGVHSRAQNE